VGILISIVALFISLKVIWHLVFCSAKQTPMGVEFNLSRLAEIILILIFLLLAVLMGYGIYTSSAPWYGYIIPVLVLLVQFGSVFQVWSNRNDFIRLNGNSLAFKNNEKEGVIEFTELKLEQRKTEAVEFKISGDASGPFLIILDHHDQEHAFDLKMMNLAGHVRSLRKYIEKK
jgi:uncharacterized protein YacL